MIRFALSLVVFLAVWQLGLVLFDVPAFLLPSPLQIADKFWFMLSRGGLMNHIPVTVMEIVSGFVIGAFLGVVVSFVFDRYPPLESLMSPVIVFIQTAPKIAIAPLLLLWLGIGASPKIVLVAIVTFFPVLSNMLSALRAINPQLIELASILKLSPLQRMWRIELPQSLPMLFSGLKVGATLAVTAAVIGELMGARAGLGYLLILGQETADVSLVMVSVLILAFVGYLTYLAIVIAEKRLIGWHESAVAGEGLSAGAAGG